MSMGSVGFSASSSITPNGLVWKEKSRWWNSLCSNTLTFNKDFSIRNLGISFVWGTNNGFGVWDDENSDWCQVVVKPIEND